MSVIEQLTSNSILMGSVIAWFIAQLLKTFIEAWRYKSFSIERMWSSGGMPSSHASTVCALATGAGMQYGFSSFEFAVGFIFASIVMYDASGVRRETGKQAKLLNILLDSDIFDIPSLEAFDEKLKELVGHTPIQVMAGAVLGIIIGILINA